jgi:hypothetical protein
MTDQVQVDGDAASLLLDSPSPTATLAYGEDLKATPAWYDDMQRAVAKGIQVPDTPLLTRGQILEELKKDPEFLFKLVTQVKQTYAELSKQDRE